MSKKTLIIVGSIIISLVVIVAISIGLANTVTNSSSFSAPTSLSKDIIGRSGSLSKVDFSMKSKSKTGESEKMMDIKQEVSAKSTRLVIKTGIINMVVKDITDSAKNIIKYTESKNGWIVSSESTEQEKIHSSYIVAQVPSKDFNDAIIYFKGLAEKVSHEEIQGQDITEEYTDLESNLKNLEATENQLREIMKTSGAIMDVLAVQKELTMVRGQIEQIKGRMQYLKGNVEMSTIGINLALSEELLPISSSDKWRPIYVIKQAWSSFLGLIKGLSYFLIWIVIYSIVIVPVVIIVQAVKREFKKRKVIREGNKKV
ncbi:DUF4349 domain-containing protein [Patescibacteria group bacterium]|nr:DUF4349 domain-containing protein [Patescibacteria group bacterium]MBU0879317.1 DUF4349 domain-containing protein [Patescibacteria group bacterium]MBU0880022.1 DUF4349 domain-containing protein [Patescibacteria group bacterium]MBU0897584.1 DUF4349 domain-containing protein [Patescibacteria group bacterium]MBU1783341.1 DUF4349 domain-containing protein [Patescibacteria group bacterium]